MSDDSKKSEYEIFREELHKYLELMAEKGYQPDPDAAIAYLDAEVERRLLIAKVLKPFQGLAKK